MKLILALNTLYNQNSLKHKNLYVQLLNLIQKQSIEWTNEDIILSNPNQWTELLIYFKKEIPHFEKFEIKLPHARGNAVDGVGNHDRVRDFYNHINDLGIVGTIDLDSYQIKEVCSQPICPISDGLISIYIADEDQDTAFVGWGLEFRMISLDQKMSQFRECIDKTTSGTGFKIITNAGKQVAKALLSCGLPPCEIVDVVIAEKLIANGDVEYRCMNLKTVFKRYDLPQGLERSGIVHRLAEIWEKQEPLIISSGLETVFVIESRLLWVTAKIEDAGMGVDVDALLTIHDELTHKTDALAAELKRSIPPGIPLHDRGKIQEHLNSTYGESLAKIDQDSLRWVSNEHAKKLVICIIEYWNAVRERHDVESYIAMTGVDDRARDSIDQLNTKTGRFYRPLQTVQKEGGMRSLFRSKEGYKFIVADYSQQEARIIAGLSNDQTAIALFKGGNDIYLETAKAIIGDGLTTSKLRALGKEIVLGLNNGRSAYSIYEDLERLGFGYDLDDVHGMIFRYEMDFAGMKAWRDKIVAAALDDRKISTPLGRALKVAENANVNSLINFPVQATAADGFKLALIKLDKQLDGKDARIVHILHDEVIIEAKEDIADVLADRVKNIMEQSFKEVLPEVPMVVEPVVRSSWG